VRVHSDAAAHESADSVDARAYTVGKHIVFNRGEYHPETAVGQHLLAHELTHVIQQGSDSAIPSRIEVGPGDDFFERIAHSNASRFTNGTHDIDSTPRDPRGTRLQRFSKEEHIRIGNAAYASARPQNQPSGRGQTPPLLSEELVRRLRDYRHRLPSGGELSYGELVEVADHIASFELLEQRDRERAGRSGVLPLIWDWIEDETHYFDLAARNRQHFHPHNFMAWQPYQWKALHTMSQAWRVHQQAVGLQIEVHSLLEEFDRHSANAKEAIHKLDDASNQTDSSALEKQIDRESTEMARIVRELIPKREQLSRLRDQARNLALRSVAINGFGNHFLTDAFSAGHIVTPRAELIDDYATRFIGFIPVGGVLHCANIPSLAWHDLDNRFGVQVNNRKGDTWVTFGDKHADEHAPPGGESDTMKHVVEATRLSLEQLWQAARGEEPSSLEPVLDEIPRPTFQNYPSWGPAEWDLQLRYAAGENVPQENVPNDTGEQMGTGLPFLSFRTGCPDIISEFTYDGFVVPVIESAKRDHYRRFFTGSPGQIVDPDVPPVPQESVRQHVALGSLVGLAGGALLGALAGPLGAVIGGIIGGVVGLFAGGFIGGLIGKKRGSEEES
jgi:hypothetical protein